MCACLRRIGRGDQTRAKRGDKEDMRFQPMKKTKRKDNRRHERHPVKVGGRDVRKADGSKKEGGGYMEEKRNKKFPRTWRGSRSSERRKWPGYTHILATAHHRQRRGRRTTLQGHSRLAPLTTNRPRNLPHSPTYSHLLAQKRGMAHRCGW